MLIPPTTFKEQQVKLSAGGLAALRAVCVAQDTRRALVSVPDEDFRNMMNWARQSFRAAAILEATSRLLRSGVAQRKVGHSTETILARVLAKAQQAGLEGGAAELAILGVHLLENNDTYSGFGGFQGFGGGGQGFGGGAKKGKPGLVK